MLDCTFTNASNPVHAKKKSSYQIQNIKLNIPSSSSVKTKQKEKGINKERSQKLNSLH